MKDKIAIVIPSLGVVPFLKKCLEFLDNYNVFVHLDGSSKDSEEFLHEFSKSHLGLKWWAFNRRGQSYSLNFATSAALSYWPHTEWIINLQDDIVALPGWDENLEHYLRPDRVFCFNLISPGVGSFPPAVDCGHHPSIFNFGRAMEEVKIRKNSNSSMLKTDEFFGTVMFHRSVWNPGVWSSGIRWNTEFDPYSGNDIAFLWSIYLARPDTSFCQLPRNIMYHFGSGSIRNYPELGWNPWGKFIEIYGLNIGQAWEAIYTRSEKLEAQRVSHG